MSAQPNQPDWAPSPADPMPYARTLAPAPSTDPASEDDFSDLDDLDSFDPDFPAADPRPTSADDVLDDEDAGPDDVTADQATADQATADQSAAPQPAAPVAVVAAPAKKGLRTSEFWQTLFTQLLALAVSVVALFGGRLDSTAVQALVPAAALFASAASSAWYSQSRSKVKSAHPSTLVPPDGV
ncbi:hypothetical protein [Angustibacter luteus]|uniref:Holin n=1 Tax=Angustibacter luteus TaxID=658456 RepID=A0ABW1JGC5_9ACTN